MSQACKEIQDQIAGYVDQELEPVQASTISHHLGHCPECAQEASAQKEVKTLVHEHAKHVPAPVHLRAEIRRNLERKATHLGFLTQLQSLFLRQPLPVFAMAVVLMMLSGLATHYFFPGPMNLRGSDVQFVDGSIEGEIVCVDCILMNATQTPNTHDATHRLGLRCKDGKLWSILPSDKGRELIQNSSRHHQRVRIVGHLFESLQYIEVKDFSLI